MEEDECGWSEWLPVVKLEDGEYAVDIEERRFCRMDDPHDTVGFYTKRGRQMVKAMIGMEWRCHTTAKWLQGISDRIQGVA